MKDSVAKKDRWDKAQVVGTFLSGVMIPLLIGYVGYRIAGQQERMATASADRDRAAIESRTNADRAVYMISLIGSADTSVQELALALAVSLDKAGKLPPDVLPAVEAVRAKAKTGGTVSARSVQLANEVLAGQTSSAPGLSLSATVVSRPQSIEEVRNIPIG